MKFEHLIGKLRYNWFLGIQVIDSESKRQLQIVVVERSATNLFRWHECQPNLMFTLLIWFRIFDLSIFQRLV